MHNNTFFCAQFLHNQGSSCEQYRAKSWSHVTHGTAEDKWVHTFSSVQSLSCIRLFVNPWTAARQVYLSITNSPSPPILMSTESMVPSNHLILCHSLLLLPSIFPSIRVFSNESALHIRWSRYWSFSFSISPSNDHPGPISFKGWIKCEIWFTWF